MRRRVDTQTSLVISVLVVRVSSTVCWVSPYEVFCSCPKYRRAPIPRASARLSRWVPVGSRLVRLVTYRAITSP